MNGTVEFLEREKKLTIPDLTTALNVKSLLSTTLAVVFGLLD